MRGAREILISGVAMLIFTFGTAAFAYIYSRWFLHNLEAAPIVTELIVFFGLLGTVLVCVATYWSRRKL